MRAKVGEKWAAALAATMAVVVIVVAVVLDFFFCIRSAGSAIARVFFTGSDWAVVGVDAYSHVVLVHPGVVV